MNRLAFYGLAVVLCLLAMVQGSWAQDNQQPDNDEWQVLKEEVVKNPFQHSNQFSINLGQYGAADWHYPLPNARVISPFGGKRRHGGTDLKRYGPGYQNDSIRAAFPGMVVMVGPYFAYGNLIVVRHANGLETAYSHNSKNLVRQGQWVQAGQAIAIVGRTGRATTEHLHFEVRVNGQAIDSSVLFDHPNHRLQPRKVVFTQPNGGGRVRVTHETLP